MKTLYRCSDLVLKNRLKKRIENRVWKCLRRGVFRRLIFLPSFFIVGMIKFQRFKLSNFKQYSWRWTPDEWNVSFSKHLYVHSSFSNRNEEFFGNLVVPRFTHFSIFIGHDCEISNFRSRKILKIIGCIQEINLISILRISLQQGW